MLRGWLWLQGRQVRDDLAVKKLLGILAAKRLQAVKLLRGKLRPLQRLRRDFPPGKRGLLLQFFKPLVELDLLWRDLSTSSAMIPSSGVQATQDADSSSSMGTCSVFAFLGKSS
jgi:hypothetical protein